MKDINETAQPFIVVRMRADGYGEKYLLKIGEGVNWEVMSSPISMSVNFVPF